MQKITFLLILIFSSSAVAGESFNSALPFHNIFPKSGGIIFPSLLTAAGVNPAALPQKNSATTALGFSYSPPPGGSGPHEFGGALARGDKRMGLGVGYLGSMQNALSSAVYLGGGFRSESTSLGLGLRDSDLGDGFAPETDIGIIASGTSELAFGLVMYNLQDSPQIDFGIGFGKDKSYNFEVNVLMPNLSTAFQQDAAYTITAATNVYASIFGVSFSSSYRTFPAEVTQSVSLMIRIFKDFALTIQYRSPNRSYYGIVATF